MGTSFDPNSFVDFTNRIRQTLPALCSIQQGYRDINLLCAAAYEQLYATTQFIAAIGYYNNAKLTNLAANGIPNLPQSTKLEPMSYSERLKQDTVSCYQMAKLDSGYNSALKRFQQYVEQPIQTILKEVLQNGRHL